MANTRVRPLTPHDLPLILDWRNHADVRRYMFSQHEISVAEHAQWFESASRDTSRHLLVFEREEVPVGFVHLREIAKERIADWGFYTAPDAPKGTGRQLGLAGLEYAFERIKLHKVCGQALAFNERSARFHSSLGFRQEGILREQHYDGQNYHDIICFGLLATEWKMNFKGLTHVQPAQH